MKKQYIAALTVLVAGIIVFGITISLQPVQPSFSDLYWEVETGEKFEYSVLVWGANNYGNFVFTLDLLPLNGTMIEVIVTNLPSLDTVTTILLFTSQIIKSDKVEGTFANGTELTPFGVHNILPAISGCILPNGSWSSIDSFYPDSLPSYSADSEDYATILHETNLNIMYQWSGPFDDGGGWSGNVSLVSGLPTQILWKYTHSGIPMFVQLTLIV